MIPDRRSLSAFLDWLRNGPHDFEVSDAQFIDAYAVIEGVLKTGGGAVPPIFSWQTLLAPVLCSSQAQQQEFYDLFISWFGDLKLEIKGPGPTEGPRGVLRWLHSAQINRAAWLYVSAAALIIGLSGWFLRGYASQKAPPKQTVEKGRVTYAKSERFLTDQVAITPETPLGGRADQATAQFAGGHYMQDKAGVIWLPRKTGTDYVLVTAAGFKPAVIELPTKNSVLILHRQEPIMLASPFARWVDRHQAELREGFMSVPIVLVLSWLVSLFRRALELRRWAAPIEPRMRRIGGPRNRGAIFKGSDLRRLSVALRRRRHEDSTELDMEGTAEETCRGGGLFLPIYEQRSAEAEYLLLGERKNLRDQQSRFQDELLQRLRDHDVSVQRYYFQSDPSVCSDLKGRVFGLHELSALHSSHQLWVAFESTECIEPVSGEPKPWFGLVETWREKVLLSFTKQGTSPGMGTTTPTRVGLEYLAGVAASPDLEPFPSLLRTAPERWVRPLTPAGANLDRLNVQLRLFLGPDGFLLLQACAVYPALAWNITLTLAVELVPPDTREEVLSKIVALPWFRHGTMPDWLRARLLAQLGADEPRVRSALRAYLDQHVSQVPERQEALEIVPGKPLRSAKGRAINDYIYLSFVSGRRLDRLSAEAPPRWRRFLRDSVWLRVACAAMCLGLTWPISGWAVHSLSSWLLARTQTLISVESPTGKFAQAAYLVALGLEPASQVLMEQVSNDALVDFRIASLLLGVNNPLPSAAALEVIAEKAPNDSVHPGMIAEVGNSLHMVKAERNGTLLLFGLDHPIARADVRDLYDLTNVAMPPPAQPSLPIPEPTKIIVRVPSPPLDSSDAKPLPELSARQQPAETSDLQVLDQKRFERAAKTFGGGFGEFRFGMSPTEVSNLFRDPLPPSYFENLLIAPEYKTAEVRYFWVRLSELQSATGISTFLSSLAQLGSCMQSGSQSYIVFLFVKGSLVRISSRFFSVDCPRHGDLILDFIKQLGIFVHLPVNAHHVTFNIGTTNLTWTIAPEESFLDVWEQNSPKPLDSFGLEDDQRTPQNPK